MKDRWLTIAEAAEYLGTNPNALRMRVKRGQVPASRYARSFRFRLEDLDNLLSPVESTQVQSGSTKTSSNANEEPICTPEMEKETTDMVPESNLTELDWTSARRGILSEVDKEETESTPVEKSSPDEVTEEEYEIQKEDARRRRILEDLEESGELESESLPSPSQRSRRLRRLARS